MRLKETISRVDKIPSSKSPFFQAKGCSHTAVGVLIPEDDEHCTSGNESPRGLIEKPHHKVTNLPADLSAGVDTKAEVLSPRAESRGGTQAGTPRCERSSLFLSLLFVPSWLIMGFRPGF